MSCVHVHFLALLICSICVQLNKAAIEEASCKSVAETNGVYRLSLEGNDPSESIYAYCLQDPDETGGYWTVIQRRIDGSTDFYRGWKDYVFGFGDLHREYFIGLDKLHRLTYNEPHELWIQLRDWEGKNFTSKYTQFAVGDAFTKFKITKLGAMYAGDGDSMSYHAGQKFTTFDHDNDKRPSMNCAETFKGAWWHNDCLDSSLNGLYITPHEITNDNKLQGIVYASFRPGSYSLKYAHMAIRPIK